VRREIGDSRFEIGEWRFEIRESNPIRSRIPPT
jgi:hypothetical protein